MTSLGESELEHVELIVGGFRYTVAIADLQKHPESFFTTILKKEWKPEGQEAITIERDGALFKYVFAYLLYGHLPRKSDGTIALDRETVDMLKCEADFYNLPDLVDECSKKYVTTDAFSRVAAHDSIRSHIDTVKSSFAYHRSNSSTPTLTLKYESSNPADLVNVLCSACDWKKFCWAGCLSEENPALLCPLFKSSTAAQLNVQELLKEAKQSPFGRGTETVIDTTVRNSFEIEAASLNTETLLQIASSINLKYFASYLQKELRPYKLVIYQEGGHFDQHRDTVRGDNHIGTLVVILNSAYTGGELEISHGGKTEQVTGPFCWVAMYGDCLHKINPVTSGTRVSLIYDIYAIPFTKTVGSDDAAGSEGSEEECESDDDRRDPLGEFFSNARYYSTSTGDSHLLLAHQKKQIWEALDREWKHYGTVVICLAHLYPACQSNPSFLKGSDLTLFDALQERYQVSVEAVSIYMSRDEQGYCQTHVVAAMFDDVEKISCTPYAQKKQRIEKETDAPVQKTLFVIPAHLNADSVLDYSPYIEHTGNDSQNEETVYLVAGLQVRKL